MSTGQVSAPPGAPTQVVAIGGNQFAAVSWTPPAQDGGAAITAYIVTPSGGWPPVTVSGSPPANVGLVTGLTNGTAYTFTVAAVNSVGTGDASVATAAVTPAVPGVRPVRYVTMDQARRLNIDPVAAQGLYADAHSVYEQIDASPMATDTQLLMWAMQEWGLVTPPDARLQKALDLLTASEYLVPLT